MVKIIEVQSNVVYVDRMTLKTSSGIEVTLEVETYRDDESEHPNEDSYIKEIVFADTWKANKENEETRKAFEECVEFMNKEYGMQKENMMEVFNEHEETH